MIDKKFLLILITLLLFIGISLSATGHFDDNSIDTYKELINVTDMEVTPGGYGMYKISCQITPLQNVDYLEMVAIWYDKNGVVIDKSPLLWNINQAKTGQVLKASGEACLYEKGNPNKVDILLYKNIFSSDESNAIYKQTLNL